MEMAHTIERERACCRLCTPRDFDALRWRGQASTGYVLVLLSFSIGPIACCILCCEYSPWLTPLLWFMVFHECSTRVRVFFFCPL